MPFRSTKTYGHQVGLSAAFRQWRANSHCRYLHGYALSVRVEFEATILDENNWVVDFGGLKDFKAELEHYFDHSTLVALDDPHFSTFQQLHTLGIIQMVPVVATGCESFAKLVSELAQNWLDKHELSDRVKVYSVEVCEHGANSAIYYG